MRRLMLALVLVLTGCGGATSTTAPTVAPSPSFAERACEGTQYVRCVKNVSLAMTQWPGKLIAICEYADGEGDIVLIDSEADAEGMCSGDGLVPESRVLRVVQLP